MKLACVYISAQHFHETVAFYEQLLEQVGKEITPNRWVEFSCGHTLAVMNAAYDDERLQWEQEVEKHYNKEYIRDCIQKVNQGNDVMIQNYVCNDLKTVPENRGAFTIVLCVYFHAVLVFQFDRPGGKRIGDYRAL